jgi:Helix-turn-helix domain
MLIAHKIALDPNNKQRTYFARASGAARGSPSIGLWVNGESNTKRGRNRPKHPFAAN